MSKKPTLVETLQDRFGNVLTGQHLEVLPGQWVRLFGTYERIVCVGTLGAYEQKVETVSYDVTFKVGAKAKYDSYNLIYYGEIVSIGSKTVTIKDDQETRRLSLAEFSRRNHNFNLEKAQKHNEEELQCL